MAYNGINPRSNKDFNFDIEILDSLLPLFLMRVRVRHTAYVHYNLIHQVVLNVLSSSFFSP